MRYWHPFSDEAARAVRNLQPDQVVLLPLYPHFSTTTTGSSLTAWREAAAARRPGRRHGHAVLLSDRRRLSPRHRRALPRAYDQAAPRPVAAEPQLRVLFSAHGLPEVIVAGGDPYHYQIESTVEAVLAAWGADGIDYASATSPAPPRNAGSNPAPRPRSSAPPMTRSRCSWCRSPSSRNTPRHWSSSTSNTANWPTGSACPAISGCRRRTPMPRSSPHWRGLVRRARGHGRGSVQPPRDRPYAPRNIPTAHITGCRCPDADRPL